ncbi:MAG: Fic family protein [Arcobacteraceae bacterium]|nr:Fic family protein [Arcobacteraceae bacterium]
MDTKKWIWQHNDYPNFKYDKYKLEPILLDIKYYQGLLNGIYETKTQDDLSIAKLEILTTEALDTSAIEGEILSRNSVRSSISKKLGIDININDNSNIQTDGLIDILLDATNNCNKEFNLERLFGWHNALFPTGFYIMNSINVSTFRGNDEMQIVSGPIGKEKVHYIAPPRDILDNEMNNFLKWLNDDSDLSIIKAGIAHLWFVIIHPMDDGNGRITRALTDMLLSRESKQSQKMYSISNAIKNDKKTYYDILEKVSLCNMDITIWLEWFLNTLLTALKTSKANIGYVLQKTTFWDKHNQTILNERQIKVLNRLLDVGYDNFEGGINTRKYASITKISKPTASREIKDLVQKNCLIQNEGTAGRNISYSININ